MQGSEKTIYRTISPSILVFLLENLMEEIKPLVSEKQDFRYGDESILSPFFGSCQTYQDSHGRNKIGFFPLQCFKLSWKFLIKSVDEVIKPVVMRRWKTWNPRVINFIGLIFQIEIYQYQPEDRNQCLFKRILFYKKKFLLGDLCQIAQSWLFGENWVSTTRS